MGLKQGQNRGQARGNYGSPGHMAAPLDAEAEPPPRTASDPVTLSHLCAPGLSEGVSPLAGHEGRDEETGSLF